MGQASICEPIIRALPAWFGIEGAIIDYLLDIDALPTFIARREGQAVGFLTLSYHNEHTAEVHIIGVHPDFHRRGIGQMLLGHAEAHLATAGVEYLLVKTLGPSHPDIHYARTRAFYAAMGFKPLQEFKEFWDAKNPCLLMIKVLAT
jgi:ribosomal protein S18 acetylase RimI-like enzyme